MISFSLSTQKTLLGLSLLVLSALPLLAQDSGVKSPLAEYTEKPNPATTDPVRWDREKGLNAAWGSIDVRYEKELPPASETLSSRLSLSAWKGEKVSAQFVAWNAGSNEAIRFTVSDLRKGKEIIPSDCLSVAFVRYVLTDELNKDGKGGCGDRPDHSLFDSTLVADPIDHITKELTVEKLSTRPGWLTIHVPHDAKPGTYSGTVTVERAKGRALKLPFSLTIQDRTLPAPSMWSFCLDLWQNPYAVARYYDVPLWSDGHFAALRPYMEMYRDAGGKFITASIMHKPWNGQTEDYFRSMISWERDVNGQWVFDFSVFDKWVSFMTQLGIKDAITCYSMVPWDLSFPYYDHRGNETVFVKTKPGEKAYTEMWTAMLTAFAKHLKEKGWFDRTYIAMDERPHDVMQETLRLIKSVDPDFKVSLAGALHEDLSDDLDYFCVPLRSKYAPETLSKRQAEGDITTYYTSCEEPFPNTFTFSDPADTEWFGWYAAKAGLDGYLRWAYNSWTAKPLLDSRFRSWPGGDTYFVYPGGRTSIRFERLIMGVQAYEKIRLLRDEFQKAGNMEGFELINRALGYFNEGQMPDESSAEQISRARALLKGML